MIVHPPFHKITPELALWCRYDPAIKADLFSTAISTATQMCLIDPISLSAADFAAFGHAKVDTVIVTNQNHWRAARNLTDQYSAELFAHPQAQPHEDVPEFTALADGDEIAGLQVKAIDGATPGEIALWSEPLATLVIGDALINFDPYGFTFLPRKYCADHRRMRRSLEALAALPVERIFFGHGFPVVSNATERLRGLLRSQ